MPTTIVDPSTVNRLKQQQSDSELFDVKPYDLPIPKLDGTKADRIELKITGTITLDPTDEHDLALISSLLLDQDVTLQVEAAIQGKAFKVARGEDETTATHTVTARVHTLYRNDRTA